MQLYWLKYKKPHVFKAIKHSLHLPQYMSYLISGNFYSDITSIGCHTNLWNFQKNDYHDWVYQEGIDEKLAPIVSDEQVAYATFPGTIYRVGLGLHDSSAALIPYLVNFHEPFILISTGTWCISLNPFNSKPFTREELDCDCLSYMTYKGISIKASRLFGGNEHEQQVKRIANHFNKNTAHYKTMEFNPAVSEALKQKGDRSEKITDVKILVTTSLFEKREMSAFNTDEEAYHQLMMDIVTQQQASTQLVLKGTPVKRIFVDGGFSNNQIYMNLLAAAFPGLEVYAASMAQATAVGTALAIHNSWNTKPFPNNLMELKYYSV